MGQELKRMRYFDGLFLNAEDYKLDQDFYLRLQRCITVICTPGALSAG